MLANILNSDQIRSCFALSFSYRYSSSYHRGVSERIKAGIDLYPLAFPSTSDNNSLLAKLPRRIRKYIFFVLRLLISLPLSLYEIVVLYILLIKVKPDVLHINNGGYPGSLSARLAVVAGKLAFIPNIVMVVNNMAVPFASIPRFLDYPLDMFVASSVTRFITGSNAAGAQLSKVLNIPKKSQLSIPNGFDISPLKPSSSCASHSFSKLDKHSFFIGVPAVLVPRKGHQFLIEAFDQLLKNQPSLRFENIKIFFAGDGVLELTLKILIRQLCLDEYFVFLGHITNIESFITNMDLIVLPSLRDEDFPNVIIESMALGKAVVGSSVAGIPEQILDGITGFLVEPGNHLDLMNKLSYCFSNRLLIHDFGRAGLRRYNQEFTLRRTLAQYFSLYSQLACKPEAFNCNSVD